MTATNLKANNEHQGIQPSDVIAFALRDGFEATLAAHPWVAEHRDALQALVDADAELTALEHKARDAQSRLDAVDQELSALIYNRTPGYLEGGANG